MSANYARAQCHACNKTGWCLFIGGRWICGRCDRSGWPFDDRTDLENAQIEATYNELCLHHLGASDAHRRAVARNIVARFRRDIRTTLTVTVESP